MDEDVEEPEQLGVALEEFDTSITGRRCQQDKARLNPQAPAEAKVL